MRGIASVGVGLALVLLTCGTVGASTVLGLSIEDQARLSKWVVVGEVVSQKSIDHPEFGIETAVTLRVTDVLRGKLHREDTVVFHTRQGVVGTEISETPGEASFSVGQQTLVFIEEVDGRLYNLGLSMGVWNVHPGRAGATLLTRAITDGLEVVGEEAVESGPIDLREMFSRVADGERRADFDNPMLREAALVGR